MDQGGFFPGDRSDDQRFATARRGSGSVRTKNGAKAVGRLPPKEPTFLNRPSPSFCAQRRGFAGTSRSPGEPKVDRWSPMDTFEREASATSLHLSCSVFSPCFGFLHVGGVTPLRAPAGDQDRLQARSVRGVTRGRRCRQRGGPCALVTSAVCAAPPLRSVALGCGDRTVTEWAATTPSGDQQQPYRRFLSVRYGTPLFISRTHEDHQWIQGLMDHTQEISCGQSPL